MALEIRLFGHADVSVDGVPIKFAKRSTTLAMLALVVLRRGHAISRESLAFTLYPESDETAALAELRRYLYLLMRALPERAEDPWLIIDAETVRWNEASPAAVDVIAFERLAASANTHAEAIALYAGDLLEDVYDDWVVSERERLRARYLEILTQSLDRHRANRAYRDAITCATRILTADPWREDTLRSLMTVRYESGDTAGALADYERFSKKLRDELAIAPMAETLAVRQSILRNDAVPGSVGAPPPAQTGAGPAISILPFVGRRRESAALHAAWSRAARGSGALLLLSGEAGVGKTRLTAELARVAQAEGGRVFAGTTAAPESMPYQALVEALRSALPLLLARPPAAARRAALASVLPEMRDPDSAHAALPAQSAERETGRLYDALTQAIRTLASPRPLLLVLEDLHWAGAATTEALGAIVRELGRTPVLILATCRDEETPADHPLRALQRSLRVFSNVDEIELERLGEDDVAELVSRIDDLPDKSNAAVETLFARSEGNALFLSEAITAALEQGDGATTAVPDASVARLIAARIERLGDEARTVAEIAAVNGNGCGIALLREVSNLPAAAIGRGLDELLDRRILREAGARARYDYVFTHHLIAEAMYGEIEPELRARRHARIARVLQSMATSHDAAPAREMARHHEQAGDAAAALGWYLTAANEAVTVHAYADAITLATRALALATSDDARRAALDVRERSRGRRGDRDGQREDIAELERLAAGDLEQRFDVLGRRVRLARSLGHSDEEGNDIALMATVAESLDDRARARALVERATHAGLRSRPAEGLQPAREALAIYERLGHVHGQLECLFQLVDFTANTGDLEASRAYLAAMHDRASTIADRVVEASALAVASTAALLRQEYGESFKLATRGLALNLASNDLESEAFSRGRLAVTAAWLGDFSTSLREFALALDLYESLGNKRGVAITHTNRTVLLMRLGLFTEALASIEISNTLFETVHEQRTIVANRVNASFVRLQLGDPIQAKALAHAALVAAREIAFPAFEAAALANLGNAELALGEIDLAIEHMEAGIALRRPIQEARDFADDLSDLTLAYARADRKAEAMRAAEELFALGADSFVGSLWPHYPWWALAKGFAAGGRADRAREAEARAREELRRFADRIEDHATQRAFLALPINVRIAGAS